MDLISERQILVAGATGLIGSELVRSLLSLGYRVLVLTRNPQKVNKEFPQEVGYLEWDGGFSTKLVREVEKSYAVVNLSGAGIAEKLWTRKRRMQLIRSRLGTTRSLAKACGYANPKPSVFVQASAIGFYPTSSSEIFNEESTAGTTFLSRLTADWEKVAQKEIPNSVRLAIIRTGVVLSSKGGMLKKLVVPIKFYMGALFGRGKQMVSWIHIHDEVNAILHILSKENISGVFNLVAPNPINQKTLVKSVAKNLHRPAFMGIPAFFVNIFFGEMGKELLLSGQTIEPKRLIESGFEFAFPEPNEAIANLLRSKL
jgi:uncharacterized protein (TIGR01777 family)